MLEIPSVAIAAIIRDFNQEGVVIKEGIEKIEALVQRGAVVSQLEIEGRKYTDQALLPLQGPQPKCESVTTLTGFVDLLQARVNQFDTLKVFVSVESPKKVLLANLSCDPWGRRDYHIKAELPNYGAFLFGNWMDQESFIIGLQTFFDDSPDRNDLLRIAGNLTAGESTTLVDDGVTQQATARNGVALVENILVKRIVTLKPWRTFREISQPEGQFLFRLKNNADRIPSMALFVADGELWQIEAMQDIKKLIEGHTAIPVIA